MRWLLSARACKQLLTEGAGNEGCLVYGVIFVMKIKTRTRIIGLRFQNTRTRIIHRVTVT